MHSSSQFERDAIKFQLLESLKDALGALNDLRLVPHNDPHVLRLKQHLRKKIVELEPVAPDSEPSAA
jgi:hypothetical protein